MEVTRHKKFNWHHFDDNSKETLEKLEKDFKFHDLDIEDVASGPQQPKTDFYKDYLFAILHFPVYNNEEKRIHVFELDVFLSEDFLITVAKGDSNRLADMREQIHADEEYAEEVMSQGAGFFLYKIIDNLTDTCWPVVRKISTRISDIEDEIYSEDTTKGTVWRIALIRRNLIRLQRIVNPQLLVVSALVATDKPYLKKDLSLYFDDIRDTLNRVQSIIGGNFDVMNTLHNVNESLISQRTNDVIKLLTVISVSLLPMTLLTGFYGMNVQGLPFVGQPNSVWLIFGVLLLMVAIFLGIFRKKDWI